MPSGAQHSESGQAAVEAALTLPLTIFLVLGTLQLFMMLQARIMLEHAAFRSVRTGSLSQGHCQRMMQSALLTVLPTFARTDTPKNLAAAFAARANNQYDPGLDSGHNGQILWVIRESPTRADIPTGRDDHAFDNVDEDIVRLELRLVFWYPMKIPFANWVIARIAQAHFGINAVNGYNPLSATGKAPWTRTGTGSLPGDIAAELTNRTNNPEQTFVFPIQATAAMRTMTPARWEYFPTLCQ